MLVYRGSGTFDTLSNKNTHPYPCGRILLRFVVFVVDMGIPSIRTFYVTRLVTIQRLRHCAIVVVVSSVVLFVRVLPSSLITPVCAVAQQTHFIERRNAIEDTFEARLASTSHLEGEARFLL